MAGKHVLKREPIQWRRHYRMIQNRWYAFLKPKLKANLRKIFQK